MISTVKKYFYKKLNDDFLPIYQYQWKRLEYRQCTYFIISSHAFFVVSKSIYIVSTAKKEKGLDVGQHQIFTTWRRVCDVCVCVCAYINSRWTAYSLDIKGIWSSANLLANIRALSQCNRSLLI